MKSLQSLRSNTYYKENYLRAIALGMSQKKIDKLISTRTISKIRLYEPNFVGSRPSVKTECRVIIFRLNSKCASYNEYRLFK